MLKLEITIILENLKEISQQFFTSMCTKAHMKTVDITCLQHTKDINIKELIYQNNLGSILKFFYSILHCLTIK